MAVFPTRRTIAVSRVSPLRLLREGTTKRSSKDIAEQVDAIGATSDRKLRTLVDDAASSTPVVWSRTWTRRSTCLRTSFAIRRSRRPKSTSTKHARWPSFSFNDRFRSFWRQEQFQRAIYGTSHPASLVAPPAESIKKLTSKDLADFHSTYYRPNNAILAIVGDVTMKEIMPKLEKAFGDWQKADVPVATIPASAGAG